MSPLETYPDLFELGTQAFKRFLEEFKQYGVTADEGLALHRSQGMLCYYSFEDRQIYLSVPDLRASTGKLQLLMFRQLLCADNSDDVLRFLTIFIPFIVAHEMAHHFRHRAGLFGRDSWHEEQLANCLASAVNKYRISPAERRFAVSFLERAVKGLGEQLGLGESAIDSYYDIVHALQASDGISGTDVDNFRLVQGVAPELGCSTTALRHSGALDHAGNARLDRRDSLISNFNREYASDPVRYIYYQAGWVYLTIKSSEANYVDEFARVHLAKAAPFLTVNRPGSPTPLQIRALFRASREASIATPGSSRDTLARYFYKRYRSFLLIYLEQEHLRSAALGESEREANFDVLSIWDDRSDDPLNYLSGMMPAKFRDLFPMAISTTSGPLISLPEDLPTDADRELWGTLLGFQSATAKATIDLLSRFEYLELFRALPPETLISLGRKSYRSFYAPGEVVVWQGDTNRDVFILVSGLLALGTEDAESSAWIRSGEIFGEIAWLTQSSRSATVRAVEPSSCLVIKEHDLQILAYQSPAILQSVAGTLARRLRANL